MDGAGIIAKSQYGYAKSAQHVGLAHTLFRALDPVAPPPLDPACLLRSILFICSANPINTAFLKPAGYGKAIRYALVDVRAPTDGSPGGAMQPGDYITGPTGTYFAASLTGNEDPMVIQCNETLSISRPAGKVKAGRQGYSGQTVATDTPLMTSWPASVLDGGRQQAGPQVLPGDVNFKGVLILMPSWPGVVIRTSDHLTDSQGRAYTINGAELTALGWRITGNLADA